MIHLKITSNIKQVRARLAKLPMKFEKYSRELALELAKFGKKNAKLRAPVATGTLKDGIDYKRISDKTYSIGVYGKASRYARYVERGYRPHWIPVAYMELHYSNPGAKGKSEHGVGVSGGYYYARGTAQPFLSPAIERTVQSAVSIARKISRRTEWRT